MKKSFIVLILVGMATYAQAMLPFMPAAALPNSGPVIHFDVMVHDFGTMKEGDEAMFVFKFTNKGNEPLIVSDVEQPCGCTVPSWSKEPIMPGKSGEIKVSIFTKDRAGIFRKTLAVKTNAATKAGEPLLLMVKANVLTKKQWKQRSETTKK